MPQPSSGYLRFRCFFDAVFRDVFFAAFFAVFFAFTGLVFAAAAFAGLAEFGDNLAIYQGQVTRFLTFASDEKPFPFAPFPARDAAQITTL